jgi:hypothetical protein
LIRKAEATGNISFVVHLDELRSSTNVALSLHCIVEPDEILRAPAFDLRPNLLMKISSDPFLLQGLTIESYAEPVVFTFFMWAQQFNIAKSFLTGDGGAKSFNVSLLESLS